MDKFINLFTDFGFKKIFGSEPNKDLLIHFLNTLLNGKEKIKDLVYLKSERLGKRKAERKAIYDLFCENQNGEKFIVEVQRVEQQFFKDRSIFYSTFPIQEQAKTGKWDYELKAVYMIGILDFSFEDTKEDKLFHKVQLIDVETYEIFYHKLTYIYLEIPKFDKKLEDLENDYERWLYAFKNLHKLRDTPQELQDGIFQRLMELAEVACLTKKELGLYQESLKEYWDLDNSIDTAFMKGEQSGIEKGKELGLEEGKELGLQEGEQIGVQKAKYKTAEKCLLKGFSVEETAEITELSLSEVQEIAKNLGL